MKWKGIIFDLDGVLCSTDQYHYMAWKRVADQLPVYFDEEINQRLRGVSRSESLEIILEKYTGTPLHTIEKQKILAEKNQIYRTALEQMNEQGLSAEVRDTILRLREKGTLLRLDPPVRMHGSFWGDWACTQRLPRIPEQRQT